MLIFAYTLIYITTYTYIMTRATKTLFILAIALAVAAVSSLFVGPVHIPAHNIVDILLGREVAPVSEAWRFIVLQTRLPQTLTAVLCGSALSVCGLLLQNLFRNPLADPSVFGISSGAALGVAVVMLLMGGSSAVAGLAGMGAVVAGAFVGAMAVTLVVYGCALVVRSRVALLIIGLMIGYLASSAITLLNYFATEDGVKQFLVWGMGSFVSVSPSQLPWLAVAVLVPLLLAFTLVKRLDIMLLGDAYAQSLGVSVPHVRRMVLLLTGFLTAVTTAFCGPIAFIGLAVPHLARMAVRTDSHLCLMSASLLMGALVAVLCQIGCSVPGAGGVLPINAVTPLVGAPVVLYVILHDKK